MDNKEELFILHSKNIAESFIYVSNFLKEDLERDVFKKSDEKIKELKIKYAYLCELENLFNNIKNN